MSAEFRTQSAAVTHEGRVRSHNEDSLLVRDDARVWVVADGMGGHKNGQQASAAVVEAVRAAPLTGDFERDAAAVADAVHGANRRIYEAAEAQGVRMGSTVVALMIGGGRFACFWAGDSRIYLLRNGSLYRLTRDHTQVEDMVEAGLLQPEEARTHPMAHVLSRAVGVQPVLQLDAVSDEIAHRDVFLLCSDGLTGHVSDAEIAAELAAVPPEPACRKLLDLVMARGAKDNVTLVAVACEQATALSFAARGP